MKLLIITHLIPYPLSDGGRISQYALIDYLRNKCSITVLVFTHTEADAISIQHLKETWGNVNFEVISLRAPVPVTRKRNATHFVQAGLKAVLHKANVSYEKLFAAPKPSLQDLANAENERLINLVDFLRPRKKTIIDQVSAMVQNCKPDLVQMEFVYVLDLSLCIPKEIKKIFVHHELRYKRIETEFKAVGNDHGIYGNYLKKLCEVSEIELLKNFDAIVTVSEDDKDMLLEKLPGKKIESLPFPILDREIKAIKRDNSPVKKLVFIGGEFHSPNKDAVEWYIRSMGKMILEKYRFILHVIGNWSAETICKYSGNPCVCFTGYIENLGEYCKNSIMVVPLRIGSGIRQKILYAVAWGVPVISTTLGSEGIAEYDKMCLTANTPNEFAEAIAKINDDPDYFELMASNAQSILKAHYSQEVAGDKRLLFYKSVLKD